jgi:ribokinase
MIIVFGSINVDLNMKVNSFPKAGETVLSSFYDITPGGKGANQALAAARIGAKTAIVGKVGDDGMGLRVLNNLKRNEVMTSGVAKSDTLPTGMATIIKEKNGNNRVIVASGANVEVNAEQAPSDILHEGNILLVQMELPIEQNAIVMKTAHDTGAKVILNLAPALEIPKKMLELVDYLIVNQIEARQLAEKLGMKADGNGAVLAAALAKEGNLTCILTMGPDGIVAVSPDGKGVRLEAMKLGDEAIDTTGAGDCFCGTFTACLHEGKSFEVALKMATIASGLSCKKEGTQDAYPYLEEINELMPDFPDPKPL